MEIENDVLFARRSAGERNRIARSFRRKGIRLLVVLEGKGTSLLVVLDGRE